MWVYSDLDLSQLIATMRRSRAVISMAHGEPFGLTAIEALSVGSRPYSSMMEGSETRSSMESVGLPPR